MTVDQDGNLSFIGVGRGIITASCGEASATCRIIVNPVPVVPIPVLSITLSADEIVSTVGQTDRLIATVKPDDADDKTVVWSSDNEEVVTVDQDGNLSFIGVGRGIITASCGEASATCRIIVNPVPEVPIPVISITLDVEDITLQPGESEDLTAVVEPADASDKTIIWTSDNEDVAVVDENGTVTAVGEGEATITATCGDASATCRVTVIKLPDTPRKFMRKGDGTSSTFIVLMDLSDEELEKQGYRFIYGFTDEAGDENVMADTNLRYCHTTPQIFNDPANDFWVFAYQTRADGSTVNSGRLYLDDRIDTDFDGRGLIEQARSARSRSGNPDNWIKLTRKGAKVSLLSDYQTVVIVCTADGAIVSNRTFEAGYAVNEEIDGEAFRGGIYVVTVKSGEETSSKKILIR